MKKVNKDNKKKNKQKLSKIILNNFYMLKAIAKHTPLYFLLMIVEGIVWGFINAATAVFTYNLINAVDGGNDFLNAAKIIGVMALYYLFAYAFDNWYWKIQNPILKRKLALKLHEELFEKSRTMDLACFDDPEFYNDFVWAMKNSDKKAIDVIEDTGKLINRIVASTTLFSLLLSIDLVVALILLATSAAGIICNTLADKVTFTYDKELVPHRRKKDYAFRVFTQPEYLKEIRTKNVKEIIFKSYDEANEKSIKLAKKYGMKTFMIYGFGWQLINYTLKFVLILYMILMLQQGKIEVAGFAASMSVVWKFRSMITDLVDRLTKYNKHSLYIEKYLGFLKFEPKIKAGHKELTEFETLEFKNVSFRYDFSSNTKYKFHEDDYVPPKSNENNKDALKNVNLKISKGDKVAIVGYNGAGKTTLIKLIFRFYDPSEGVILYNGIDIREFDPQEYRKLIGAVFQDYKMFATSIAHNVMNGEFLGTESEEKVVKDALRVADFNEKLESLSEGIYTHLTREFNDKGTNLSGGEAQKVAISRVFANNYPIVIMDEPSSALDPMAEYNLNKSILNNTGDKTVIFISHRLSTTRIADIIYMFDSGRLIEQGTHSELLDLQGKYAEMFTVQSKQYETDEAVAV